MSKALDALDEAMQRDNEMILARGGEPYTITELWMDLGFEKEETELIHEAFSALSTASSPIMGDALKQGADIFTAAELVEHVLMARAFFLGMRYGAVLATQE